MEIKRPYDAFIRCPAPMCNIVRKYYFLKRDEKGNCEYTFKRESNVQDDINSYRDGCSLELQLMRMKYAPVQSVLQSLNLEDTYSADVSKIPNDLMELNLLVSRLRKTIPNFDEILRTKNFNDIVADMVKSDSAATVTNESEVNENGSNE